jgi:hypothetical protein
VTYWLVSQLVALAFSKTLVGSFLPPPVILLPLNDDNTMEVVTYVLTMHLAIMQIS